ncbi:fasciclin-3-like [Battus philenor]|uniref:fasciclin-3-like n=1 Tax=Battus philenor TaxID=42288 RepID=UPI0035D04EB1
MSTEPTELQTVRAEEERARPPEHAPRGQLTDSLDNDQSSALDALSSPPAALVVRAEPEPPRILFNGTLLEPKQKIMLSAGTRAAVVCKVRYGRPPAHVEWHLDSRRLTPLSQMNTSEIGKPDLWTTRSILEIEATRFGYGKQLACRAYHPSYPVPHYRNAYALLDVASNTVFLFRSPEVQVEQMAHNSTACQTTATLKASVTQIG